MDRAIENNKVNFLTEMMVEDMIADPDQIKQGGKIFDLEIVWSASLIPRFVRVQGPFTKESANAR